MKVVTSLEDPEPEPEPDPPGGGGADGTLFAGELFPLQPARVNDAAAHNTRAANEAIHLRINIGFELLSLVAEFSNPS